MTTARHLNAVTELPDHRHSLAVQLVMKGRQAFRVRALAPEAGPRGQGHLIIRVGRTLIYIEDREALLSLRDAVEEADNFADRVFGPALPPLSYGPRS